MVILAVYFTTMLVSETIQRRMVADCWTSQDSVENSRFEAICVNFQIYDVKFVLTYAIGRTENVDFLIILI
jgi:hypothetical protein